MRSAMCQIKIVQTHYYRLPTQCKSPGISMQTDVLLSAPFTHPMHSQHASVSSVKRHSPVPHQPIRNIT